MSDVQKWDHDAQIASILNWYRANPKNLLDGFTTRWVLRVRQASKRQDREFVITARDLMEIAERQEYRCALTGLPFDPDAPGFNNRNPFGPSVDRIDCARGYTPDNVRLVCVIVNHALNSFGDEAFLKMCRAVCEQNPSPEITHE